MPASVAPGQIISHYRLLERIGAGGMGEVYVALDTRSDRRVALKFLNAPRERRDLFERFRNEARLHARLFHPNIARLFGFVVDTSPPFLVMELVDGPPLRDWLRRTRAAEWRERLRVFIGIAEGVGYLHANGIVHRDLKPGNVRLTRDGRPKLLDFGIARDSLSPQLTMTGNVVGTLQFLAPEQLQGKTADARSDVWALGVLLYELLTGRLPFAGESLSDLVSQVRKCRFPPPTVVDAALPGAVDKLVKGCLRPDPNDRPRDGTALAAMARAALGEDAASPGGGDRSAGDRRSDAPSSPRRASLGARAPIAWKIAAGFLGVVAVGAGLSVLLSREEPVAPAVVNCDQVASGGATFPVNIQGNGGTFEVWVNGIRCGTAGAAGVWFRASPGTKLVYECRPLPHGNVSTTHQFIVGATNIYSCP